MSSISSWSNFVVTIRPHYIWLAIFLSWTDKGYWSWWSFHSGWACQKGLSALFLFQWMNNLQISSLRLLAEHNSSISLASWTFGICIHNFKGVLRLGYFWKIFSLFIYWIYLLFNLRILSLFYKNVEYLYYSISIFLASCIRK